MAIYSVSVPIFFVLTMIVSVRGQSAVVANVQDSKPCYGSIIDVTCSFPEDLKPYRVSSPSWTRNGDLFQLDAKTHTLINYNSTVYILRINLTGEDFLRKTLEYTCFLVKKGSGNEQDESDVYIAPQVRPLAPVLENVTLSEGGTTVSWNHDNKCFRSCSFTYNVTLFQVTEGGNSIFINTTRTTQPNVTFVDLIGNETYKLLVIAQAICENVSTLTSEPLEVEFEGKEYSTPSSPTITVATVPLMTESPADESNHVAIIVGVVVPVAVVLALFTAIVIVICIWLKKKKTYGDDGMAADGTNIELDETDGGKQGPAVIYGGGEALQQNEQTGTCETLQELKKLLLSKEDSQDDIIVTMRPTCWKELRKELLKDCE